MTDTKQISLKHVFITFFKTLRILWQSEPKGVLVLVSIISLQAFLPAVTLLLIKWTVDEITQIGLPNETFPTVRLIGFWLLVQIIQPVLNIYREITQGNTAEKFTAYVNLSLLAKAADIHGLSVLENKAFHDDLNLLKDGASRRPLNLVVLSALTIRDSLIVVSLMVVLVSLAWWVPLALILATLPATVATVRLRDRAFHVMLNNNQEGRYMSYLSRNGLDINFAKEMRLFQTIPWLQESYESTFLKTHKRMRDVRRKELTEVLPIYSVSIAVTGGLFAWAVWRARLSLLTAGQVVLILQALAQTLFSLRDLMNYFGLLLDSILYFTKYFDFLSLETGIHHPKHPKELPEELAYSIEFRNVTFSYPDGREAIKNASFIIPAGKTVALVGENGSGKTTLVKLILKFYDPDEGVILINGINLADIDTSSWRRTVSAVFQDFNIYSFSLLENIFLGNHGEKERQNVAAAVKKAGLQELLSKLENGLNAQLGKEFGGTELSGGQGQKVAIARALMRPSRVLILDEPTASLDPRSEHVIFERFSTMAKRPTTVMITHRLMSTKNADQIIVMKDGQIIEEGNHDQLLLQKGEYYELWTLQLGRYAFTST